MPRTEDSGLQTQATGARQWLCLMVPQWPLVAAQEQAEVDPSSPMVLVERSRVRALSPAAWAGGVRRGMKESTALHLMPELVCLQPTPRGEQQRFTQVTQALFRVSAQIYQLRPGVALMPVGQNHQHSSVEELMVHALDSVVQATGYEAHAGVAWGMASAIFAAHHDAVVTKVQSLKFLHTQPVQTLVHLSQGVPQQQYLQQLIQHLTDLGLKKIGEWARWSGAQTGRQFGKEGRFYHRAIQGHDWALPTAELPASDLQWELTYDPPLESYEQLLFQARMLVEQAVEELMFRSKTCDLITVKLVDTGGNEDIRTWVVTDLDLMAMQRSIRWHLEGWLGNSQHRQIQHPLAQFIIIAHEPQTAAVAQNQLWSQAGKQEQALRVANRLEGLLGGKQVQVPVWQGSYDPSQQVQLQPWQEAVQAKNPNSRSKKLTPASFSTAHTWPGELPAPFPSRVNVPDLHVTLLDAHGYEVSTTDRGVLTAPPLWVKLMEKGAHSYPIQPVLAWRGPWVFFHQWWQETSPHQLLYLLREDYPALLVGNHQIGSGVWVVEGIYE